MSILVSVVIPNYNYEKFLAQCIDSVLNQSYSHKEIIVVDDCSTDNSRVLIRSYGDKVIPIFPNENGGHANAFNLGFKACKGEIVAFLDADDFANPGWLENIVRNFETSIAIYHYYMDLVDINSNKIGVHPSTNSILTQGNLQQELIKFGRINSTVTSGLCFSRSALEKVMPIDKERYRQGADGYLLSTIPFFGNVKLIKGNLTCYRQHNSNHSKFDSALTKRAFWCYEHNINRYSDISHFARKTGLKVPDNLGLFDIKFLEQLLVISISGFKTESSVYLDLSRFDLFRHAIKILGNDNNNPSFTLKIWWICVTFLPLTFARPILAWKLQASSRPILLNKFLSFSRLLKGLF